jgi:hypothetical protein
MPAQSPAVPPLNLNTASQSSGRSGDIRRSGSTVFNIGGNPNISALGQNVQSVLTTPFVPIAVAFIAVAIVLLKKK